MGERHMAKKTVVSANSNGEIVSLTIKDLNKAFGFPASYEPRTLDDLEEFWGQAGGVVEFEGSDWDLVKDKHDLVGKPFVIADVRFYTGKFGDACAVMAMLETRDQRKVVFNDGSTGVFRQVESMVRRHQRRGGFRCPNGLRASEYQYVEKDFDGKPLPGAEEIRSTTFYIG